MIHPVLDRIFKAAALGAGVAIAVGAAHAQQTVFVTQNISTSTTWTANKTYNLQGQIYVLPGASLTIQAGTVVASTPTANGSGSLAVCKGAQIFVQGTETNPVIMTSTADVATWTGGDPRTGTWREAANEWGNLTIMGAAYISENATPGNVPSPNANNVAAMEGLTAGFPGDTKVLYGGGNDNDDSGSISYLSIRYGGRVIGLANELNGLSLGGIGRATDIHHVEIMNNVDDGIEIWGGTVNLKYVSIWNIGDDSFDIDQGWRGQAQFVLIVQGYSLDAGQGSGVGDNCFETDGAEDSDWQPLTTAAIYNATVIGQPLAGDHGTAWRDNARVQYRNCIFMDLGEKLVAFDNVDGDGANGYGFAGTLSWDQTWTTDSSVYSLVNAPGNPAAFYQSQLPGKLAEIKDSVFYNNVNAAAYTEADARGVRAPANNNVTATQPPISSITRGAQVTKGGKAMVPVTFLDPTPANDALTSVGFAPYSPGGFLESAHYRGAFAPGNNWLAGWTASTAYGFTPADRWGDLGKSLAGTTGAPVLTGTGNLTPGSATSIVLSNANPNSAFVLAISDTRFDVNIFGGTIVPNIATAVLVNFAPISPTGSYTWSFPWPGGFSPGQHLYLQAWVFDPFGPTGFLSASNAIYLTTP